MQDWLNDVPAWLQTAQHVTTVLSAFLIPGAGSIWVAWVKVRNMVKTAETEQTALKPSDIGQLETRITTRIDLLHKDVAQVRDDLSHTREVVNTLLLERKPHSD